MQPRQVQQLLPVQKTMELNEQQMLVGITQMFFSKAKVTSLVYIARVDSLVGILSLYLHQVLMDLLGSITE